jgi:hypothetical protein
MVRNKRTMSRKKRNIILHYDAISCFRIPKPATHSSTDARNLRAQRKEKRCREIWRLDLIQMRRKSLRKHWALLITLRFESKRSENIETMFHLVESLFFSWGSRFFQCFIPKSNVFNPPFWQTPMFSSLHQTKLNVLWPFRDLLFYKQPFLVPFQFTKQFSVAFLMLFTCEVSRVHFMAFLKVR